jgi:A nuclease family of the HNH/ENDO VII superfamily with conserved AHH
MMQPRWPGGSKAAPGFQRHHLIPLAILARAQMVPFFAALAGEGLYLRRFADNGQILPASEHLAARTGHALHRGPHPGYTDVVGARVEAIRASTRLDHAQDRWMACARIGTLQSALRRALTDSHHLRFWLNRRDPMRIFADRPYLDDAITALYGGD